MGVNPDMGVISEEYGILVSCVQVLHVFLPVSTSEQLQQFIPKLLAEVHVEALVHGNISQQVYTIIYVHTKY